MPSMAEEVLFAENRKVIAGGHFYGSSFRRQVL